MRPQEPVRADTLNTAHAHCLSVTLQQSIHQERAAQEKGGPVVTQLHWDETGQGPARSGRNCSCSSHM